MKTLMASLLLILGWAGSGLAADNYESTESGNTLLAKCVGPPETQLVCAGYTAGIYDMINFLETTGAVAKLHCFPSGITRLQIHDVVVRYLQDHPEQRRAGAAALVRDALQEAWPCRR
ncbi:MAG: hypothetical protein JSS04_11115 [Proteobacteria bacterium]|nr:hypothetical protein [Pseudomonadota bacterium]